MQAVSSYIYIILFTFTFLQVFSFVYIYNIYLLLFTFFSSVLFYFFFFFQAEDGIRDGHVTGVQTCALPIYGCPHRPGRRGIDPRALCRRERVSGCVGRRTRVVVPLRDRRRRRSARARGARSEEHTSELQSRGHLVCRLLLEKKKEKNATNES